MSKPLSEDSISYIIVAYDDGAIHFYHLRANTPNKDRVAIKFELLAEHNGWKPFKKINVIRLSTDEELESITEIGPESFR